MKPIVPTAGKNCQAHLQIVGATAIVNPKNCPADAFLVSYQADNFSLGPTMHQTLFSAAPAGAKAIGLPPCIYQVDFVRAGTPLAVLTNTSNYVTHDRWLAGILGGTICLPSASSTSTTKPQVLGSSIVANTSTTAAAAAGTPTTDDATVLATQTLPRTGASHVGLEALLGLGMMAIGGSILATDRRRKRLTA